MNTVWIIVGCVIGAIVLLAILGMVLVYNSLVRRKNEVQRNFADVDTVLKKRYDLIPNLVNTVKGYAKHESELLTEVVGLRNSVQTKQTLNEKVDAYNKLEGSMHKIFALAENYPQLQANENFLSLQHTLTDVENEISGARSAYNQAVTALNLKIESFPSNIVAKMFKFQKGVLFEVTTQQERENVKVEF